MAVRGSPIGGRHPHASQADGRDLKAVISKRSSLHITPLISSLDRWQDSALPIAVSLASSPNGLLGSDGERWVARSALAGVWLARPAGTQGVRPRVGPARRPRPTVSRPPRGVISAIPSEGAGPMLWTILVIVIIILAVIGLFTVVRGRA